MKLSVATFFLISTTLVGPTAYADTLDNFVLTFGSDTYSFSLPSPLPGVANSIIGGQFQATGVLIDRDGVSGLGTVNFYGSAFRGGLQVSSPSGGVYAQGATLFTPDPTVTYPIFTLGTTTSLYVYNPFPFQAPASITITATSTPPSTVPEPSSIALLGTGLLAIGNAVRRHMA